MSTMWKYCYYNVKILWLQCENIMITMWKYCDYNVKILWLQCENIVMRTLHVKRLKSFRKHHCHLYIVILKTTNCLLTFLCSWLTFLNKFKLSTICQLVITKFLTVFSTVVCRTGVSLNPSISASSPWQLLVSEIWLQASQVLY